MTKSQRNQESQWLSDRIRSWLNNHEIIILSQTTVWFTLNNYECSSSVSSSGNMEIYVRTLKTWLRILIQFVFLMSLHWPKAIDYFHSQFSVGKTSIHCLHWRDSPACLTLLISTPAYLWALEPCIIYNWNTTYLQN